MSRIDARIAALADEGKAQLLNNPDGGESESLNLTMQEIKHFVADYCGKDSQK